MATQKHTKEEYTFDNKWSPAIAAHGHTSIPNLLLRQYISLGITTPELRMIIALEMYRWDDKEPYPGVTALARLTDVTPRRARAILTSLHTKGLVMRTIRNHDTSSYNPDRLILKLDQLAISSLPPGRKDPPHAEETRLERKLKTSPNEYAANNTPQLKPIMNTGIENVGEIFKRRYSS